MRNIGIMEKKRNEMRRKFLALPHYKRIDEMGKLFGELLKLKAQREDISQGEAYQKYIERPERPNR